MTQQPSQSSAGLSIPERAALVAAQKPWAPQGALFAAVEAILAARLAAVIEAVEATYPPLNYELLYDGREDPTAAAYVDAYREVDQVLDQFRPRAALTAPPDREPPVGGEVSET